MLYDWGAREREKMVYNRIEKRKKKPWFSSYDNDDEGLDYRTGENWRNVVHFFFSAERKIWKMKEKRSKEIESFGEKSGEVRRGWKTGENGIIESVGLKFCNRERSVWM